MNENLVYVSYGDSAVVYNKENGIFSMRLSDAGETVRNASLVIEKPDGEYVSLQSFPGCKCERLLKAECNVLKIIYEKSANSPFEPVIEFSLDASGIKITVLGVKNCDCRITGEAYWGEDMENDTFAMCLGRSALDIRCAMGPATSGIDNALYDRKSDIAFVIEGGKSIRYKFNWDKKCYNFDLKTGSVAFQQKFKFFLRKNILAEKYSINFSPINKNSTFKKPPAGWMTWYAVKFDACEEKVLENVKFQAENLKKYGADAVWVDWEWYHTNLNGVRSDGVNTFVPDGVKYPHGMKYISDKIKEAGFVPALWVGFTHDSSRNEFTKAHPEIILAEKEEWCGCEFYDMSHPLYLNEFLPKALGQVFRWGYEAVKFDTLPIWMEYHENHHMKMYDPTLTTRQAFRNAMQKARDFLGKDMYMLSCCAINDNDFLWASDIFDAGRVGNDVFEWEEFIKEGVEKVLRFYPLHNIVLYPDMDNVILREEFNTLSQAQSRIFFVSLLGLPITFGDEFKVLPSERVELIKKCLPVMDIHPMDINVPLRDPSQMIINLSVERPFESYNIVNVFNVREEGTSRLVNIESDLHLEKGEYHIFDFKSERYLGSVSDFFEVRAEACESKIYCVRRKSGKPQIVSTSRHISQGAVEIKELFQDENKIKFTAELIGGDNYKVYVYVPDGYSLCDAENAVKQDENIYCFEYMKPEDGLYELEINYEKM